MIEVKARRRGNFVGTGRLYNFLMRSDGRTLGLWVVSVALVAVLGTLGVRSLYSTPEQLAAYQQTSRTSAVVKAINGVGYALDTSAGIFVLEVGKYLFLGVALLNMVWVVRHTRASEEVGRLELVRSGHVGPVAPPAAAGLTALTFDLALATVVGLVLVASGFPVMGSAVYGFELFAIGVFFAAVAMLLSQLFLSARSAFGWGVAVLATSFLLRAAGDVSGGLAAKLSPLGWVQAGAAYGQNTLLQPALPVAVAAGGVTIALFIAGRRDLGAGIVSRMSGSPQASVHMKGPLTLTFSLQRPFMIAWVCALLLVSLGFGSVGREVDEALGSSRSGTDFLSSFGPGVDAYFAMATLMLVFGASGFALAIVARAARDESNGVVELLLSTTIGRTQWMVSTIVVAVTAAVSAHVAIGLGLGISRALIVGHPGPISGLLVASFQYLPATAAIVAAGILAYARAPGWVAAVWLLFSVCIVFGLMGQPLKIPQWLLDISPFEHVHKYPDVSMPAALAPIMLIAIMLASLGLDCFSRLDIT